MRRFENPVYSSDLVNKRYIHIEQVLGGPGRFREIGGRREGINVVQVLNTARQGRHSVRIQRARYTRSRRWFQFD